MNYKEQLLQYGDGSVSNIEKIEAILINLSNKEIREIFPVDEFYVKKLGRNIAVLAEHLKLADFYNCETKKEEKLVVENKLIFRLSDEKLIKRLIKIYK